MERFTRPGGIDFPTGSNLLRYKKLYARVSDKEQKALSNWDLRGFGNIVFYDQLKNIGLDDCENDDTRVMEVVIQKYADLDLSDPVVVDKMKEVYNYKMVQMKVEKLGKNAKVDSVVFETMLEEPMYSLVATVSRLVLGDKVPYEGSNLIDGSIRKYKVVNWDNVERVSVYRVTKFKSDEDRTLIIG